MLERDNENDVLLDTESLPEDTELEAGEEEASYRTKLHNLKKKLDACTEEKRKSLEDLSRARADFLNSKKRNEEQLVRDRERITERHIEDLLPLADSFEMAMKDTAWESADPKWRTGIESIHTQLMNIFKANNVEVIDPIGAEFNPHEHEALTDSGNGSMVSIVIQRGYKVGDRLIRAAKVAVGN